MKEKAFYFLCFFVVGNISCTIYLLYQALSYPRFDSEDYYTKDETKAIINQHIKKQSLPGISSFVAYKFESFELAENYRYEVSAEPVYGRLDAPVTIVEYGDIECGYCKTQHAVLKKLVDQSEGKINWVWRSYPSDAHNPLSFRQSSIAYCLFLKKGNKYFWAYLNDVVQDTLLSGNGSDEYLSYAFSYGITKNHLKQCVIQAQRRVLDDIEKGERDLVERTPTLVIMDNLARESSVLVGYHSYNELKSFLGRQFK